MSVMIKRIPVGQCGFGASIFGLLYITTKDLFVPLSIIQVADLCAQKP